MKIIGMIPARLGSSRVKNKNLRLLNGRPLVQYIIDAAKESNIFDSIYLNSEASIFEEIASESKIKFYKRPENLSTNQATNDDFAFDFLDNIECDILVQLLPTSPFVTASEIKNFVETLINQEYETLISVSNIKIEANFKGKPINFDRTKQTPPSQLLEPIQSYACSLMGWNTSRFRDNYQKYNAAYHGGDGSVGFFVLKGFALIDIDEEEDFLLAEAVAISKNLEHGSPQYYSDTTNAKSETDVPSILVKDGVEFNDLFDVNKEVVSIDKILNEMPKDKSWSKRVIDSESNSMTVICQMPGEGNRKHHHPDWNEWWYILEGEWEWEIENKTQIVKAGDIVFMEKNRKHKITAAGRNRAIRMAISRSDVAHVYE